MPPHDIGRFFVEVLCVCEAATAKETFEIVDGDRIDLVTRDLHLGADDGFESVRTLRNTTKIPIVMVTGKDDVIDKIVALEVCADD